MKAIRNKTFFYLFLALCLTCSLMLIKKTTIIEDLTQSILPRKLFESSKKNYICEKAGDRLTDKYKTDFQEETIKTEKLSDAQQAIIDFARESSYSNIKPYVKKCAIFIVFIVLDIIFIFLWITYCSCCCCGCGLFRASETSRLCAMIWYIISCVSYLLVIIVSIVILSLLNSFFARINGLGCSAFYFIDHVRYGLAPSYTNRQNEWTGIEGIIERLEYTDTQRKDIKDKSNSLSSEINGKSNQYSSVCQNEYNSLKSNAQTVNDLIGQSFDELTTDEAISDLRDVQTNFDDADKDLVDNYYDAMHDHTNKLAKRINKAFFTLTLIFAIAGIVLLTLHIIFDFCLIKVLYIIVWNISMLLMFISILLAAIFGILGYILGDAVEVGNYILSTENLHNKDPLIFDPSDNNSYISNIVDVCANGDGNFTKVIEGGEALNEKLSEWNANKEEYEQAKENINCGNEAKTNELKGYYDELLAIVEQSLNMSYNITNVSCSFAKNDKNILLNEVDTGGIKGLGLCACSFLIGIGLLISVLSGIILVHKYNCKCSKGQIRAPNNQINESNVNIAQ